MPEPDKALEAGRRRPASGSGYLERRRRTGLWLVAPALLVLLGVLAYPIASAALLSFQHVTFAPGGITSQWTGLDNYQRLLADPTFSLALRNSLYFTAVEVVAVVALSLVVALLLNTPSGRHPFFRVALLIPWALAPVANAVLWKWIYNANYGVLNALSMQLGIVDHKVVWLGDPFLALNMILVADAWKAIPFISLLLLAGLQNIPGQPVPRRTRRRRRSLGAVSLRDAAGPADPPPRGHRAPEHLGAQGLRSHLRPDEGRTEGRHGGAQLPRLARDVQLP